VSRVLISTGREGVSRVPVSTGREEVSRGSISQEEPDVHRGGEGDLLQEEGPALFLGPLGQEGGPFLRPQGPRRAPAGGRRGRNVAVTDGQGAPLQAPGPEKVADPPLVPLQEKGVPLVGQELDHQAVGSVPSPFPMEVDLQEAFVRR